MDIDPRLAQYIKEERAKGFTEDVIRDELSRAGWDKDTVDRAFSGADQVLKSEPVLQSRMPVSGFPQHPSFDDKPASRSLFGRIFMVVFILVVLGAVAAGAVYFDVPAKIRSLFVPYTPKEAMLKAFNAFQEIDSYTFDASIQLSVDELDQTTKGNIYGMLGLIIAGDKQEQFAQGVEGMGRSNIVFKADFDGAADIREKRSRVHVVISVYDDASEPVGSVIKIDLNAQYEDDEIFIRFNDMVFPSGEIPEEILRLKGKWISFTPDELQELPFGIGVTSELIGQKEADQEALRDATNELVIDAIQNKNLFLLEDRGSETINGFNSYHHAYTIQKDILINLFTDIFDLIIPEEDMQNNPFSFSFGNFASGFFERFIRSADGEIWIDKSDVVFRKITSSLRIGDETGGGEISMEFLFPSYNEPVVLHSIQNAVDFRELYEVLFSDIPCPQKEFYISGSCFGDDIAL